MDGEIMEDLIPSSQESTEVIQPINRETVHRICSGQVVLSLAIAVKELVENAIDAEATIIDIRLKEYGSELVEVSDNGKGVIKENFQALTLKHYTSKIKQFDDLQSLSTLGFRGEALSSLCALSDLTILTKHCTAAQATKITYDRNGKITSETISAREQGTTVTLENLFSTLPVRRKEFLKNLKREFNKMCQLLYAYCLVSKGIKFSCTNIRNKGSKNIVVTTEGLNSVKENIINVFGAKQISSLIEIEIVKPEQPILNDYGLQLVEGEMLPFSFEFFISSVMHGSGRSTNDRQFYYINSRPCDPIKVVKLVNEVYKQYNNSQYPFVFLNIVSQSSLVDVNVTPDKRQVFLEKEKVLLATIKASLIEAFKTFPSTFKMQNLELTQNSTIMDFFDNSSKADRGLKRSNTDVAVKKGSITERFKKRSKTENDKSSVKSPQLSFSSKNSFQDSEEDEDVKLDTFLKITSEVSKTESTTVISEESTLVCKRSNSDCKKLRVEGTKSQVIKNVIKCENAEPACVKLFEENEETECNANNNMISVSVESIKGKCADTITHCEKIEKVTSKSTGITEGVAVNNIDEKGETKAAESHSSVFTDLKLLQEGTIDEDVEILIDSTQRSLSDRKSISLSVSLDDIKQSLKAKIKADKLKNDIKVRFRTKIAPEANKAAEAELQKQISKQDFAKMTIIGQFNLGFIIAKLENDLFIIDQHATDEKYNFEQLQANTIMENQILVNPKPLELSAGNETLLIDNEEIFKKNGFTFKIDESAPCTKKVSLTSVPLSKSIVFGKDDIDEMLFMLQDSNHTMCRPSRIRGIFASRACRKSIMIGKALSKSDMRRLIDHMGEIEQPWNCPHGRPTMRHLINLDLLQND